MALNTRLAPKARTASKVTIRIPDTVSRTPDELANIVEAFALSDGWIERVRLRADRRWYERLHHGPDYDVWVISWLPGQSTGFHDHGVSSGAFVVATGVLEEHRPDGRAHVVRAGKPRAFGPDYAHDVRNISLAPAISIHAYSPPLAEMNEYELDGGQLIPRNPDRGFPTSSRTNGSACIAMRIRDVFVAGASVLSTVEGSMRFVFFRRNVVFFVFLFVLLALLTPNSGHTQQAATSTASLDAKPDTVEWVYRIRYGYHDEWWRIFRKYQIAILERQ
ncbi:MAG TPA: cysteine dioxygenase family protein, partial [Terriglobales bacterium]|nr:cysteine dioxygenase family protein [Terriglobales bacterium]